MTEPMPGMPDRVTIYEVGPRDGLQNEKSVVPVEVKAEFVRRLLAAGLETVELTSFVPQRWVPQLGDAEELLDLLGPAALRGVLAARLEAARHAFAHGDDGIDSGVDAEDGHGYAHSHVAEDGTVYTHSH